MHNKIYLPKKTVCTVEKKKLVLSLEYLGKYSLEIKKRVQRNTNKQISFCKLNVLFSSKNKLTFLRISFFFFKIINRIYLSINILINIPSTRYYHFSYNLNIFEKFFNHSRTTNLLTMMMLIPRWIQS